MKFNKGKKLQKRRAGFRRRRTYVPKNIKQYVKKSLHAQIENKMVQHFGQFRVGNTLYDPNLHTQSLTPSAGSYQILNGTGQANKIGNRIRVRKAVLRYIINPLPYDLVFNQSPRPMEIQIMLGHLKGSTRTQPNSVSLLYLYQDGNTSAPSDGTLTDLIRPVNNDLFVIKRRIVHKVGMSAYDGTGAQIGAQYHQNNDFPYNVRRAIDVTKYMPKVMVWNEADVNNPTSKGLYMWMEAVRADNTLAPATESPLLFEYWLDLTYEDA